MFNVTKRKLIILAAIVWYIGGFALLLKGSSLLIEAGALRNFQYLHLYSFIVAILLGLVKARFIFIKTCEKNITRINNLENPMFWMFYRNGFFIFLILMIFGGAMLSNISHNNYTMLILIGILDLSISTALLTSSYVYWKK